MDVQKRFAENEDRLRVVQETTDRIEELAEKTNTVRLLDLGYITACLVTTQWRLDANWL